MTMRRAHYTWRNDPGTTNKWRSVTVVTNLCSTITYLAPAPITNYISQTRRQGRKNSTQFWVQKGKSVFSLSSRFVPHIDTDFSRLFWALAEGEATGECQRFSTFALIFICHISSKSVSWDGKRNRSFWHIPSCNPWDIALPAIVNVHFNFGSGHTIFLFGWFCTNTSPAHIAICIFQRHISLLFKFPVCYFQIF